MITSLPIRRHDRSRPPGEGVADLYLAEAATLEASGAQAAGGRRVHRLAEATGFCGQRDRVVLDRAWRQGGVTRTVLVGLGSAADGPFTERLRRGAAIAARRAREDGARRLVLHVPHPAAGRPSTQALVVAGCLGLRHGLWRFDAYRAPTDAQVVEAWIDPPARSRLSGDAIDALLRRAAAMADAIDVCRHIQSLGPNDKPPARVAELAGELARAHGLEIEVLDHRRLSELGAGAILGVGQGSRNPPCMVLVQTGKPTPGSPLLAMVGKGITFDSGGLSLKDPTRMMRQKYDLSGAAAVLSAVLALADLGSPIPVLGVLCLAENMPGGSAQRPGDVVRTLDGTTVEVLNTDAEGRLVLADGLAMARRRGATHLIDVATLTGACMVALGDGYSGVMGRAPMRDWTMEAAEEADERLWPLPIDHPTTAKAMQSDVATLRNVGGEYGGALNAGYFLSRFSGDLPWAHVDMGSLAFERDSTVASDRGALGGITETLIRLPYVVHRRHQGARPGEPAPGRR